MSEALLNTNFHLFEHWDNGVNHNEFINAVPLYTNAITEQYDGTGIEKSDIRQSFSSNDEVVSAKISLWAWWITWSGTGTDGYVRAIVELEKPDTSKVTILDVTKTAEVDSGYLLEDYDITAHFDQYGIHKIWLTVWQQNALDNGDVGSRSRLWTYYIEIDLVVKKYKSTHEKMGGSGEFTAGKAQFETASDVMGLSESYTHSTTKTAFHSVAESMGLLERIQAMRTQGNIITTYDISDLTDWNETGAVTTPWIKEKTEIN